MEFNPHNYQLAAKDHILARRSSGLILGVGLGKTSITLTAIEELQMATEVHKVLIVAPKRVAAHTWKEEIEKWNHTKHFRLSRIIGNEKQRIAAFHADADIYTVSRDNIAWLVTYMLSLRPKRVKFDMLVIDEVSSFRNREAMRFKAVRKLAPHMSRVVALTGSPAPRSLIDLWAPMYLLDSGDRLGKTLTGFRDLYFTADYNGYSYEIRPGAAEEIQMKISDICISMNAKDYLDLPERIDIYDKVELESMTRYEEFKKKEYLEIVGEDDLVPMSVPALYNKLLQYCNGAVYLPDGSYLVVDDTKLDALVEEVECLFGQPVIIFYQFKSDFERIKKKLPGAKKIDTDQDIDDWNAGEIQIALNQASSISHGVNLQYGGHHIIHFGLGWDLEVYEQCVGRVDRQNQKNGVVNRHLMSAGTMEEIVLKRLENKAMTQNELMDFIKMYV